MQKRNEILPIGGMNTDDDPRYLKQGDYLSAENVVVVSPQEQGDEGLIKNMKSTSAYQIPEINGNDDNWEYLGVAKDLENDRAYILALIEDTGNGFQFVIYKHNIKTDTVKIIFYQDASDWGMDDISSREEKYIHNPRIVDDNLIWTDNVNDIRMINVVRMEATWDAGINKVVELWDPDYSETTGYNTDDLVYYADRVYIVLQSTTGEDDFPFNLPTYYSDIAAVVDVYLDPVDPNNFTLAALPPLIAPTAEYLPNPEKNVNQLKGKTWQFSYQYVYLDYRKSTFAPPSLVPPPDQEEDTVGKPLTDPTHNNRIRIYINTGNEEVRYIRIVARSSEDITTWFLIDEFYCVSDKNNRKVPANIILPVDFYNDKAGEVLDPTEVYNLFSFIPITAKHMELVEGNRLVFGNIREGYPKIGHTTEVKLDWEDLSGLSTQRMNLLMNEMSFPDADPDYEWYQFELWIPEINYGARTFYIKVDKGDGNGVKTAQYYYNGTDPYPSTVISGLQAAVTSQWGSQENTVCGYPYTYKFCLFPRLVWGEGNPPYVLWTYEFYSVATVVSYVNKYAQLKTGATHSWALIYRDIVGRITGPIGTGEITKYIPFPTESSQSNVGRRAKITFELNHVPPIQAETYEVLYAGNKSISWHLQLLGYNFAYGKKDHTDPESSTVSDSFRLRVEKAQLRTRDNLYNWSVEQYVWQKGDRIRIIGKVSDVGILTEINNAIYDVEITGVFEDTDYENDIGESSNETEAQFNWIYFPVNDNLAFTPSSGSPPNIFPDNLFVEIYRPFQVETNLLFTTGMTFDIGVDQYGNKYHKGDTDQVLTSEGKPSTPAIVNNTSHDCWKYIRNFRDVIDNQNFKLWSESEYASDFYLSNKLTSQGNPVPETTSTQQNVLTKRLRHGGRINIGSQINQIADFDYDDFLDLKDEFGPIEGLRIVGFVLKAIQYNKVTSIYISRMESFTASGQAEYLFTDKVFGSSRPAMENWGTSHPGSVIVYNRHLYFWDQREGVVVRDAANGMIAISDNKMKKHFADLAKSMEDEVKKDQDVQFSYCKELNQLWCVFGANTSDQKAYTFSEVDQRWKMIIDIKNVIGKIFWMGRRLWFLNEGYLYEFFKGSTYLNIIGQSRTGYFEFYVVSDPSKPHTHESLIVYQEGDIPKFVTLDIPDRATAVGDGPMQTKIYDINVNRKEGVYYCQVMRDINTPMDGSPPEDVKLMNGRRMRGLYMKVKMKFDKTDGQVTLTNIIGLTTPSERSK